jgi:hypothetical protein
MAIDGGLRALFKKHLPQFHWQSVETGMIQRGVPDANYCCGGVEGWVEFKLSKGWTVGLRPEQVGWLLQRTRARGRTFVAVRRMNKGTDELRLYPGSNAKRLKTGGLKALEPMVKEIGGPECWNWGQVRQALLHLPHTNNF